MVKKDYIRKIFIFQPYECEAVEEFLTKIAAEGWMLDSIQGRGSTPYIFVFHKMQPKKLTFSVDYFQQGTIYDEQPYIPTMDYIEYCKQEGWNHVCTKGKMQVFCTEIKNPVPIQTDEKLKFKAINNAFFMQSSSIWLTLLFIGILFYQINSNFENLVTRYNWLISMTVYIFMLIIALYILADYIKWRIQSKKKLKTTGKLHLGSRKRWITVLHLYALLISIPLIIVYTLSPGEIIFKLIFFTILVYVVILLMYHCCYEKRNHSSRINKLIFAGMILLNVYVIIMVNVIFYSSNINQWTTDETMEQLIVPLPINESNGISYTGNRTNTQETILAQFSTYTYYYKVNNKYDSQIINLIVFKSPYKTIINKFKNDRISGTKYDFEFNEGDPVPWGADTLYTMNGDHHGWKDIIILSYKDRVLVLESQLEIPYTNENAEKIKEVLHEK
ncbi:MAG: DUF2812 domain-containing protein [Eubacteriales bacterium]